jgi:lysozyme family protein
VFTRSGGGHVALYEGEDADNYLVRGGNQSDAINVTHMPKSQLVAAIWPPDSTPPAGPEKHIVEVAKAAAADASNFNKVLPWLLEDEGGFTDEATDAGGPTNWGITLEDARMYWKPDATAADVRAMPKEVAVSIFRAKYWDKLLCDELPSGVDYAVFDFGVNSGVSRAAKFLQNIVGTDQDGEIGPETIAATIAADPAYVINTLCNDRMEFLHNAHNTTTGAALWPTYGRGWTRRVAGVRARSLELIGARTPTRETTMADTPATPRPAATAPQINVDELAKLIAMIRQLMAALRPTAAERPIVFPSDPVATTGTSISDATQPSVDLTVENMSPIDKVLGGKMFVGTKTGIGIVGLTALYILNHLGVVGTPDGTTTTTTGAVLTGLSGGLTALGATAKLDRAVQALQKIATVMKPLIPIILRALTAVA